ncbi:MAG: hypothetical protein JW748_05035 [Anaerolineales bacterium]|nr:hypothetical protein [Anaerolineales bacterium]
MPAIFPFAAVLLILTVLLVLIAVRATGFRESRAAYLAAWLSALLVIWRLMESPVIRGGLLATIAIEVPIAIAYILWRKRPAVFLITVIWMMNTVTWPLLSIAAVTLYPLTGYSLPLILCLELGVWIIEAAILTVAMRKEARFREALLLSLVLNAASFGIGLLLPF